ncbi:MAG: hypothetical protein ACYCTI_09580, partial [Acidimicrobiales bacterium]
QVSALPTGSTLNGLSTLGLAAGLAGVTSQADYRAASASTPATSTTLTTPTTSPGTTGGTTSSAAPVSSATGSATAPPAGGTTSSTPASLPFTGSNSLPLLATGLLLMVMGSQLLIIRRRLPAVIRT